MATTKIKYEGEIEDSLLLSMATFNGWTPTIPNPAKVHAANETEEEKAIIDALPDTIDNMSYQAYAIVEVLGLSFIAQTAHLVSLPYREDKTPKEYVAFELANKDNVLVTTTVSVNEVVVYPFE